MTMTIRKGFCLFALLILTLIQPVLAAGADAAKARPAVETLQLATVPMKGLTAEGPAEKTLQATPGDDEGFDLGELLAPKTTCPTGGNATFTWTIKDGCVDGLGLYLRFFDETNDLVFPNSTQVYIINSGRTGTIKLSVKRGAKICFGAENSDLDGYYWGVDVDNSQGCASCCNTVPSSGNISRSLTLICN
jgi:hypothetical protein